MSNISDVEREKLRIMAEHVQNHQCDHTHDDHAHHDHAGHGHTQHNCDHNSHHDRNLAKLNQIEAQTIADHIADQSFIVQDESKNDIENMSKQISDDLLIHSQDDNQKPSRDERAELKIRGILQNILSLIYQRIDVYRTFDSGLKIYKENKDSTGYHAICELIMKKFAEISKNIRTEAAYLQEFSENDSISPEQKEIAGTWYQVINEIQMLEKEKLTTSAKLHMLTVTYIIVRELPWDDEYREQLTNLRVLLDDLVIDINEKIDEIHYFLQDPDMIDLGDN